MRTQPAQQPVCCMATGTKRSLVIMGKMILYLAQSIRSPLLSSVAPDFMNFADFVVSNVGEICSSSQISTRHFASSVHQVNPQLMLLLLS